ncbi:hypothetical protein TIFTF001_021370 [Ficus carica]|uniref:Uncharacterized protein n=1 Tax=Ficus carica TaxID=3494 RepID=A0AA88AHC5_FICCA|nr:hypothetical protein TIFTF001_021370 [Ficus carica]
MELPPRSLCSSLVGLPLLSNCDGIVMATRRLCRVLRSLVFHFSRDREGIVMATSRLCSSPNFVGFSLVGGDNAG